MLKDGPIWALGAMSGTSLDGVDAATIFSDGETIFDFGESRYRAYRSDERSVLRAALGKWSGVDDASELVETAHAEVLSLFQDVEIVGFHGQTLAHDPAGRGTFQTGDGAVLAQVLGVPVVWDFRSADVELGGQGAPLAPFFHFACAKWIKAAQPLCFLNLGGVGNLTWVDPNKATPDEAQAILAFDTGPANAPLNDMMANRLGKAIDEGGQLAASGVVSQDILDAFVQAPYFFKVPPKSLDRDDFGSLVDQVADLSDADAAATLTAAIAASVVKGLEHCPTQPCRILVCGGGRHNATLMAMLQAGTGCPVEPVEVVGLDGDMLEAQAFAYLAIRVARGLSTSCPATTGVSASVGGGVVSYPDGRKTMTC